MGAIFWYKLTRTLKTSEDEVTTLSSYAESEILASRREELEPKLFPGDTWEDLLTFVAWAGKERAQETIPRIDEWVAFPPVVIWGETDGLYGLPVVEKIMERLSQLTIQPHGPKLVITGGVYGREDTINDIGALDMWDAYIAQTPPEKQEWRKHNVIIDSWSLHTGNQRDFLSKILRDPLDGKSVFVVLPTYHMSRFLLTLGAGLKDTPGWWPNIHPWGFGFPNEEHDGKGKIGLVEPGPEARAPVGGFVGYQHGLVPFTYEELFASSPTERQEPGKIDCGEIDKILHYQKDGQALSFKDALKYLMSK